MRRRTSKKIYKCHKLNTKKYLDRPSPPYHASECPNKIMKGNDGNKYISVASERGPFKWVKYSKKNHTKKNHTKKI